MPENSSVRLEWLDYIRATACLMVVMLHVSAIHVLEPLDHTGWMVANFADSFSRICVPLFFMASGYLFFREKAPRGKNFIRIIAALSFYSALAILLGLMTGRQISVEMVTSLFSRPAFHHLWFFLPADCALPGRASGQDQDDVQWPMLGALVILMILFNPGLPATWGEDVATNAFRVSGPFIHYLLYAVAGAIIGSFGRRGAIDGYRRWLLVLWVLAGCMVVLSTASWSAAAGKFDGTHYSYSGVFVIIGGLELLRGYIWRQAAPWAGLAQPVVSG